MNAGQIHSLILSDALIMQPAGGFRYHYALHTLPTGESKNPDTSEADRSTKKVKLRDKEMDPEPYIDSPLPDNGLNYKKVGFVDMGERKMMTDCRGICRLCWAGWLDETMEFLEDMIEKGIPPSVVAFNSITTACSRAGLEDEAYKLTADGFIQVEEAARSEGTFVQDDRKRLTPRGSPFIVLYEIAAEVENIMKQVKALWAA
ncbi:unnamed protein product [Dovyalis caffra]|uniref:Pentatricopeptide repeat-containing protein n=1 Tax=Dovyalis caffra TaxID=77055 RepID=A0AAV1SL10_9ROSI|nr:unnamed protein product [Dovyalis caffra]